MSATADSPASPPEVAASALPVEIPNFTAAFDASSTQTLVQWDSAVEPLQTDGTSAGPGISGYQVRYQRDGGPWTAWQATVDPQLLLPGGHVGEVINLELTVSDADGSVSATVDGQALSTAFTPGDSPNVACQPTDNGFPAGCIQATPDSALATPAPAAATPDSSTGVGTDASSTTGPGEYDPGPPATLTPTALGAVISGLGLFNPYRITVINNGWSTIRNAPQSYVIGSAHSSWLMNVSTTKRTRGSGRGVTTYALGSIGGDYQDRCGWLSAKNFVPTLGPNMFDLCPHNFGPTPRDFAIGLNCASCTDGTGVRTIADTQRFTNLYPNPYPVPAESGPRNPIDPVGATLKAGFLVKWRYVTTDDRWVMVRVGKRRDGFPNWVFISRAALPRHLCTRTSCTPQT
ncbi:MAG: hypothetical protein M3071_18885 [Actinomycetota bacterium]|nr:hypothetical protein [Actinomycetota bacterium]